MVRRDEISFVGARYPDREQTLVGLHEAGVPVRAYGRDWSRHPVDRLRTWGWHRPDVPAERDVDRDTAYAVMAGVRGDAQHAHRPGRLRDAHLRGVRLRRRPADRPPRPGRPLRRRRRARHLGRRFEELLELCARARVDLAWAQGLREAGRRRTLAEHTFDHRVAVAGAAVGLNHPRDLDAWHAWQRSRSPLRRCVDRVRPQPAAPGTLDRPRPRAAGAGGPRLAGADQPDGAVRDDDAPVRGVRRALTRPPPERLARAHRSHPEQDVVPEELSSVTRGGRPPATTCHWAPSPTRGRGAWGRGSSPSSTAC